MNSRERRGASDPPETLLRQSLDELTCGKAPGPEVRKELLRRAAGQERRLGASRPLSFGEHADDLESPLAVVTPRHQFVYLEALFGPRVILFSFNSMMR